MNLNGKLIVEKNPSDDSYVELFIEGEKGVFAEADTSFAEELVIRWNSHNALIEALMFLDNECDSGDPIRIGKAQIIVRRIVSRVRAQGVLSKLQSNQPKRN